MSLSRMVSAKEIIRHEEFPEVLELILCQRSLVVLIHGLRIPDSIINSTYMRICNEFNVSPRTISRGEDEEVDVRVEEIKKSLIALSPSWSLPSSAIIPTTASASDVSTSTSSALSTSSTSSWPRC